MRRIAKLTATLCLLAAATTLHAESYTGLWNQYKTATDKDQPKTAISVLRKIQKKATGEKSYGNLLAAMTRELHQQAEVSADSLNARRAMLKAQSKKWREKGEGVLATLCDVAAYEFGTGKEAANIDSLLASKDAAIYTKSNATAAYVPFLEEGESSKYCNNDLLHVIGLSTWQYDALMRYYGSKGNGKAVCLIASMGVERLNKDRDLPKIDSLINLYGDLPECGALALPKLELMEFDPAGPNYDYNKERTRKSLEWIDEALKRWPSYKGMNVLRNRRADMLLPQYNVSTRKNVVNTTDPIVFKLGNVRNISGLTLTLKSDKGATRTFKHSFAKHEEYEIFSDTLNIGRLPLGKWTVSATDDKGTLKETCETPLYVTDLRVISQVQPGDSTRYVVVNDATGQPVSGATIRFTALDKAKTTTTALTDAKGECIRLVKKVYEVSAVKGDDTAAPTSRNYNWRFGTYTPRDTAYISNAYADRSIYRPGQTVHAVLVRSMVLNGTETKVKAGETFKATLVNAEYKEVESKSVTTDEYGTAAVDFTLPTEGRNGDYCIRFEGAAAVAYFNVEDYKRPVFEVTIDEPKQDYKDGDTLHVKGYAKTYSGVAVANARVAYKISQGYSWWWRRGGNNTVLTDTVYTQSDGSFTLTMPMTLPKQDEDSAPLRCCFYNVHAEATVTDAAGESHSASISLPLSNSNAYLSCDLSGTLLADTLISFTPKRVNARGTAIDGTVKVMLDGKPLANALANKKYSLPKTVASGKHNVQLVCEGDTVNCDFVAFRKNDKVPMTYTHDWFYASEDKFDEKTGEAWIQYGSSDKDVHVVYTIIANNKVIERGTTTISNSVRTRTFTYNKSYGDGISISMAWVKDGKMFQHTAKILRPLPSKKLTLEWGTFRNKLQPGQKEEWTLKIKNPDGTAAKAQTMAVLYDKSLDAIKPHSWNFSDPRSINVPVTQWNSRSAYRLDFSATGKYNMLDSQVESFTSIAYDCRWNDIQARPLYFTRGDDRILLAKHSAISVTGMAHENAALASAAPTMMALDDTEEEGGQMLLNVVRIDETAQESAPEVSYRENLAETAFFMPTLLTDAKGNTSLKFTLPESVTTWRFMALAHDKEMRQGFLADEAIAQKQLMIQPRMPRFLRQGDKAKVSASVANLSDKQQTVKATMTILNSATEEVVSKQVQTVTVKPGETANTTFDVTPNDTLTSYICRFAAEAPGYTDGEQHILPILSDMEEVTEARSYIFLQPTDTVLNLHDMANGITATKVKVDYTDNPAWLMMETLPAVSKGCSSNAISLSTAVYANIAAASLKDTAVVADNEAQLKQLLELQNADGSFSWWKGMQGSLYMTTAVAKTLSRLNAIAGQQSSTKLMLDKAFAYLKTEMTKEVNEMKANAKKKGYEPYISRTALDWLYALTIEKRNGGEAADYLRKLIAKDMKKADMQTKAVAAIVLYHNGEKSKAREFAEAIKQHTVYREDVGRYFDSYRAEYSWCDYRIPTQSMAIEALRDVTPADRQTITEMQRWLLSSKHTQVWDTPYNTVNAVHAFFCGDKSVLSTAKGDTVLVDKTVAVENLTNAEAFAVPVHKTSNCESWAAAYVTYKQKSADVKNSSNGISVKREVTGDKNAKVGDRIKVRITVTADRDYDFVTVTDNRAACLEPVDQMSGYRGGWNSGYYAEMRDQKSCFYFNQLSKGTHTIETEYYIDREGTYTSGTTTAVCTYAPEFRSAIHNSQFTIHN